MSLTISKLNKIRKSEKLRAPNTNVPMNVRQDAKKNLMKKRQSLNVMEKKKLIKLYMMK